MLLLLLFLTLTLTIFNFDFDDVWRMSFSILILTLQLQQPHHLGQLLAYLTDILDKGILLLLEDLRCLLRRRGVLLWHHLIQHLLLAKNHIT